MNYQTIDGFYGRAQKLRSIFDRRFANPLQSHPERFQWDYWNVPGEYTLLRTPAYTYFPASVYEPFHRYLVRWGRENLGCHDISPPWLSCYIDGCEQSPHQDVPHGPLAWVYSLTPWQSRKFRGGETFIQKPRTLIEPKFNRLTIFNPSLVHGVRTVRGTHDPREGRLVVHGWFVNPRPFWTGPLTVDEVRRALDLDLAQALGGQLQLGEGFLSLRLKISPAGRVVQSKVLVNTLMHGKAKDIQKLFADVEALRFERHKGMSTLTLPFRIG